MVFSHVADVRALHVKSELTFPEWVQVSNYGPLRSATTRYNALIEWREGLGVDQEKWKKRLLIMQTFLNNHNASR